MFSGKKRRNKTVAVVDVESGSVGAALASVERGSAPKLFGETRVRVPILHTRDTAPLVKEIERATKEALLHISHVAARLRAHEASASYGAVDRAAVFVAVPWATMHLAGGTADFFEPLRRSIAFSVRGTLGEVPTTFHPQGTAVAHGSLIFSPREKATLLSVINAEITELLVLKDAVLTGRATVPLGSHAIFRTLMTHAGMSSHEARSFLELPRKESERYEPLDAAAHLLGEHIEDAAKELSKELDTILVVAHEPHAEFLAQSLTRNEKLGALFPQGGTVRALRTHQVMPFIAAHAPKPDLHLMLEALFVNGKFSGI
jgi:hypothetical protein